MESLHVASLTTIRGLCNVWHTCVIGASRIDGSVSAVAGIQFLGAMDKVFVPAPVIVSYCLHSFPLWDYSMVDRSLLLSLLAHALLAQYDLPPKECAIS